MLLPEAVFNSRVPVGLCVVMPVVKVEGALEVEGISWRMGACVTMAVEVGGGTGAVVGAGRAAWTGFTGKYEKWLNSECERKEIFILTASCVPLLI